MGELVQLRQVRRSGPEPLWRTVIGSRMRRLRQERRRTLTDISLRAGISAQYLSEVERGRKDPSSEVVAAVAGALEVTVLELSALALADLRAARPSNVSSGPVLLAA